MAWSADKTRSTLATTVHGKVRGTVQDGIHTFKGIRYGADTALGASCRRSRRSPGRSRSMPHSTAPPRLRAANESEPTSEDCLFLNVWTPGVRDGAKRPVMFYIHGGAYSHGSGSSPLYDGTRLCKRGDVVVVTVNHD